MSWHPVERLRRIWTPDKELYERADSLDPGTELDSQIRELFSRIVERVGSIELDVTDPVRGYIRWEKISGPDGRSYVTVWYQEE